MIACKSTNIYLHIFSTYDIPFQHKFWLVHRLTIVDDDDNKANYDKNSILSQVL